MTYNDIILKLKKQIDKTESGKTNIFQAIDDDALSSFTNLFNTFGANSPVYSEDELSILKKYKLPGKISNFYKEYCPFETIMLSGGVRLLTFEAFKEENLVNAPGAFLIKFGIITFATTIGGNAICFDLNDIKDNDSSILLVDHSVFCNKSVFTFENGKFERNEISYEMICKYSKKISIGFISFLEKIANDQIKDIEDFLE